MIIHITKKQNFFIIVAWLIFFLFFILKDFEASSIFVVLSCILGFYIYISMKFNHYILSIFMLFSFITHAITPPFFFINKDRYDYNGWNAVKDFRFEIKFFSEMYFYLMLLLLFILIFSIFFKKVFLAHRPKISLAYKSCNQNKSDTRKISNVRSLSGSNRAKSCSVILILFVFVFVIPMNIFMFNNRIGIMGMEPVRLPYKLTGILFYLRSYIIPVVMLYFYAKSKKYALLDLTVLLCALTVGFCSQSKGAVLLIGFPVLMFNLMNRNWFRLITSASLIGLLVISMGYYRGMVSSFAEALGFGELLKRTPEILKLLVENNPDDNIFTLVIRLCFDFVDLISNRLGGVQDIVLGYQYFLADTFKSMLNYFTGQPVFGAGQMVEELYGFSLPEDLWVGVGISLLGYIMMFSKSSVLLLIICSTIISVMITVSESIVQKYFSENGLLRSMGYVLGFLFILYLYGGDVNKFYILVLISYSFYKMSPYLLSARFRGISLGLER